MSDFPNNLRKIRLSQTDKDLRSGNKIAELLGVSPQYYYKLETGQQNKRLNVDHLTQLSKIFNVSADEILGNQSAPVSPENKKIPKDLKKILEEKTVMFDGEMMNEDDKKLIEQMLTKMYYKSKEQNKRK